MKDTHIPHSSQRRVLIIVAGPPGTGKTTLSRSLGATLNLPVLHRDALKERLFDTLGVRDRAWSRQLGAASYDLLFHMLELLLQTGQPCIVESNFDGEPATTTLRTLVEKYNYHPVQIQCQTAPAVLLTRLHQRVISGERHRGHGDLEDMATVSVADLCGYSTPLALDGTLIHVDTTDGTARDNALILSTITPLLERA